MVKSTYSVIFIQFLQAPKNGLMKTFLLILKKVDSCKRKRVCLNSFFMFWVIPRQIGHEPISYCMFILHDVDDL